MKKYLIVIIIFIIIFSGYYIYNNTGTNEADTQRMGVTSEENNQKMPFENAELDTSYMENSEATTSVKNDFANSKEEDGIIITDEFKVIIEEEQDVGGF